MITNSRTTKQLTKAELLAQLEAARTEIQRLAPFEREALELRAKVAAPKPVAAKPVAARPSRPAYFAAKSELLFIRAYCTAHKCKVAPREAVLAWRALQ